MYYNRITSAGVIGVTLYLQDFENTVSNSSQKCKNDSPNEPNWNNSTLYLITKNY